MTWPTSATDVSPGFAASASRAATSRTCPTLPAGPASSALVSVWTLSTTASAGAAASIAASAVSSSVVAASWSPSTTAPMRSARPPDLRRGLLAGDVQHRRPRAASRPATWRSSVDFPMPGSPPNSAIEPGTKPPPRTRSTSPMPDASRAASALSTTAIGVSDGDPRHGARRRCRRERRRGLATVSTSVFHAPHDGHWPAHFGEAAPHCWQRYCVFRAGTSALPGMPRARAALTARLTARLSARPWPSGAWRCGRARC